MAENNLLPPEYEQQLAQLSRRKAIADMLFKQGVTPQPTEMVSGIAIRQSPLSGLARLLAAFGGTALGEKWEGEAAGVRKEAAAARAQELAKLMTLPPAQRARGAALSQFSDVAGRAKDWEKMATDQASALSGVQKDAGDYNAAAQTILGGEAQPGWQAGTPRQPEVEWIKGPDGRVIPKVTNYDIRGQGKVSLGSQGNQVSVENRLAGREGEAVLDILKGELKPRQERAQIAKEALGANQSAMEALAQGARSGGGEGLKQGLRKAAQFFNLNVPETASTEELQMALGQGVLAKARALAPVTGEDVKRLEQILGSVNTDPQALAKMLSVYSGLAIRELQEYQRYVGEQAKNLETPYARDIFRGAGIGYEVPNPPGNTQQAFGVLQELQKRGGDVSQFADPTGERIPPDAKFDIRNLPGLRIPEPLQKSGAGVTGLSPEEQKELEALRKRFAR